MIYPHTYILPLGKNALSCTHGAESCFSHPLPTTLFAKFFSPAARTIVCQQQSFVRRVPSKSRKVSIPVGVNLIARKLNFLVRMGNQLIDATRGLLIDFRVCCTRYISSHWQLEPIWIGWFSFKCVFFYINNLSRANFTTAPAADRERDTHC
jgi:hypothetical protein